MSRKVLQVAILLAVCAWFASACKNEIQRCSESSECCSNYCQKGIPLFGNLCIGPPATEFEGVEGSFEDDFIENEDDDSFDFDEEIVDDESEIVPLTTPSSTVGKQCAHHGTPCSPKSNSCCSGRCVQWRHDSIFRCARLGRGWGRTSTTKPASTPGL